MNLHIKNIAVQQTAAPLIAITGVLGYVGRQLSKSLTEQGFRVRGLTRSVPANSDPARDGVDLVTVDYFDRKCLDAALKDCRIVIHLAGIAHTRTHANDENVYCRAIFDVTKAVYEAAQGQGCEKFIYASSINVYGNTSGAEILNEMSECQPTSYYGKYKLQSEEYLQRSAIGSDSPITIVRFPPIYGGDTANSLKYLFWAAVHKIPLPISNLANVRSILSLENLARFMTLICTGELSEKLYVLHDISPLSVADIFRQFWFEFHGSELPTGLWFGFPQFLKPFAVRKGPLAPLLLPFHLASNFTDTFESLGIVETSMALGHAAKKEGSAGCSSC